VRGGLAVLEHVAAPDFLKQATDAGLFLESELQKLSARHGLGEVRGRGLLLALISNCRSVRRSWRKRLRRACS